MAEILFDNVAVSPEILHEIRNSRGQGRIKHGVLVFPRGNDAVRRELQGTEAAALFHQALQTEHVGKHPGRRVTGIAVSEDLHEVLRHGFMPDLCHLLVVIMDAHPVYHAGGGNCDKTQRRHAGNSAVANQKHPPAVGKVRALPETAAELANVLFGKILYLGHRFKGELPAPEFLILGIAAEARFVIPLDKNEIGGGGMGNEKLQSLPVFQTAIQIIPEKDIEVPGINLSQSFL